MERLLQLNPPLPLETPKGPALAHIVAEAGADHDLLWTVFLDGSGECVTYPTSDVRLTGDSPSDLPVARLPLRANAGAQKAQAPGSDTTATQTVGKTLPLEPETPNRGMAAVKRAAACLDG